MATTRSTAKPNAWAKSLAKSKKKPSGGKRAPAVAPAAGAARGKPAGHVVLLVGTRKGAWLLHGDAARKTWRAEGPHFLGHIVQHMVMDPRDGKTILAAMKTGHLGPTLFRSTDRGRTWKEAKRPPAFPKAKSGEKGRVVDHTFWLTPCHANEPGAWYAGTSPQALFRSEDGGDTWSPVPGFNDDPRRRQDMGGEQDGTPDGPKLHSITVDPRDPAHLYLAMSGGGVHESIDRGASWQPLVDGLDVVAGFDPKDITLHDPHCVRTCPSDPDRLYQQNHCGIYRLDRPSRKWKRIGKRMPKEVGDIGFGIVPHPRDRDTAWVFPMDGTSVWPRTSPGGKPAVYVTRDAGASWERQDTGFPSEQAWWTVKRQAFTADAGTPAGVYLGTTSGEVWMSADEGKRWTCIARHLPEIYSIEAASFT